MWSNTRDMGRNPMQVFHLLPQLGADGDGGTNPQDRNYRLTVNE